MGAGRDTARLPISGSGESQSRAGLSRSSNGRPVASPAPRSAPAAAQVRFARDPAPLPLGPPSSALPQPASTLLVRGHHPESSRVWAVRGVLRPCRRLATSPGPVHCRGRWRERVGGDRASGVSFPPDPVPAPQFVNGRHDRRCPVRVCGAVLPPQPSSGAGPSGPRFPQIAEEEAGFGTAGSTRTAEERPQGWWRLGSGTRWPRGPVTWRPDATKPPLPVFGVQGFSSLTCRPPHVTASSSFGQCLFHP